MKKMFMCLIVTLMVVLQAYSAFAACCLPGGCTTLPEIVCSQNAGIFVAGDCADPGICQLDGQAVPTMTQWGMIIFMVLAGLGAVYYLRRQRRAER